MKVNKINRIYNCCSLCIKEDTNNGNNLIWCDSMQLCPECYKEFTKSDYNKHIMPINAIKKYRKVIEYITESEE